MTDETPITEAERKQLLALITTAVLNEPPGHRGTRRRNAWLALLRKLEGVHTTLIARRGSQAAVTDEPEDDAA